MNKNSLDMTKNSVLKCIILFSLPILFGNLFQQFYNLADTAIAGKFLGDDALSAIGATSSLFSFLMYFVNGLNGGFCIVTARVFGEKNIQKLKNCIAIGIVYNLVLSVIIIALSVFCLKPILSVLNTPNEVFDSAYIYIFVIFIGSPISAFYNFEANLLRSMGNSKTPIIYLVISSLLNIILDILFIKYLNFGVKGAAIATVIAQLVSAILCFVHIVKNYKELKISKENFKFQKSLSKEMFVSGMIMALMNCIFATGSLILQGAINGLGKSIIAGHLAARKIAEMFMQPLITIGTASSTFVSQNYGAKEIGRIKRGIKYSVLLALGISILSLIIVVIFGDFFISFVTNTQNEIILETAHKYLMINLPFYFSLGILLILRMSIQGLGARIPPLLSSGIELLSKCISAWYLTAQFGYIGVCVAEPISWVLGTLFLIYSFKKAYEKATRFVAN